MALEENGKRNIYPSDTLPIAYECRIPDPDDPIYNPRGFPATPILAYARVRTQDEEWLELGGVGVEEAAMTIEPATGSGKNDTGAIIKYTLPTAFTTEPGQFTMYLTAVYADGAILTEEKKYKVLEYR